MKNTGKPISPLPLRVGNVPKSLKALDRWILWRYTQLPKSKKWAKTPHSAKTGHKTDATKHENGVTFMDAMKALREHKGEFDGVGFLLGNGIGGIDVDDCIDENGNLDERGQAVSDRFKDTYAEISPSGRGFKLLVAIGDDEVLGNLGKNNGEMEIYGGQRYFTITGNPLPGHSSVVASMPGEFRALAEGMGARTERRATDNTSVKPKANISLAVVRQILDNLPFDPWNTKYGPWLHIGMALHHQTGGSDDGLALWEEYSLRNPAEHEEGLCGRKWLTFGKPGKDEVTIRTLMREAKATGWRLPPDVEGAVAEFSSLAPDEEVEGDLTFWGKYAIGPMLRNLPAPDEWIWPGILMAGKMMLLAGSGGSSKSYLMLATTIQYALGNSWGPFDFNGVEPGRVLLMYGEEDHHDVHKRVQALKFSFMLSKEQIELLDSRIAVLPLRGRQIELARTTEDHEVEMTAHMDYIEQQIVENKVKLVVMDPMALLHSLDENDNRAIARFVGGIDAVCLRTGCSVVLVHHFSKAGASKANEVNESNIRGASSLVAHARTVAVMHRMRETEAREWGVAPEEHSRWVMWSVVKSNYGPHGSRYWFNVDERSGALSPAQTQIQFLGVRAARVDGDAERIASGIEDVSAREAYNKGQANLADIEQTGRMAIFLQYSMRNGSLPPLSQATGVLLGAGNTSSASAARSALTRIRKESLVDTDGLINNLGRKWLDEREIIHG